MCPLRSTLPALTLSLCFAPLLAQSFVTSHSASYRHHDDPQWMVVEPHLPNPATATPAALEAQADLLRVRRFPEDALDFYTFALRRGGPTANLLNKIGLTQLELRNILLAQAYFRQAIKLDRRNAQGWNNLAATEYLERQYAAAIGDYKRAAKVDHTGAVVHANLSTAYFEVKDYKKARREADEALRRDPLVFQHSSGAGIAAHVLSVSDRARFAFEMARLYAQHNQEDEMLHQLAMATESGFDILPAMAKDPTLARYRTDPRVTLLILTAADLLHHTKPQVLAATAPPPPAAILQPQAKP